MTKGRSVTDVDLWVPGVLFIFTVILIITLNYFDSVRFHPKFPSVSRSGILKKIGQNCENAKFTPLNDDQRSGMINCQNSFYVKVTTGGIYLGKNRTFEYYMKGDTGDVLLAYQTCSEMFADKCDPYKILRNLRTKNEIALEGKVEDFMVNRNQK